MYPFERFTERAKKVLTLAQEEAERSHQSYIGTEHLLLGLLRENDGLAHRVLGSLGVEIGQIRQMIESVPGRNERITIRQIIPTSRIKKVIEISFEEARRMGHNYVGTEHLLLGLLVEGEGIAAHVLADLGVTIAKARAEIERQLAFGATPEEMAVPAAGGPRRSSEGSGLENLEAVVVNDRMARLLQKHGLDVEGLTEKLRNAPEQVGNLRRHLTGLKGQLEQAVNDADYERAARIQKAQRQLADRLRKAEQEWLDTLLG